jgi:hypothetical protein
MDPGGAAHGIFAQVLSAIRLTFGLRNTRLLRAAAQ